MATWTEEDQPKAGLIIIEETRIVLNSWRFVLGGMRTTDGGTDLADRMLRPYKAEY
jgi:hypothetical protein